MKKILLIFLAIFSIGGIANTQTCDLAYIASVEVVTTSETNFVNINVVLTKTGKVNNKTQETVNCTVTAFFTDANLFLEKTSKSQSLTIPNDTRSTNGNQSFSFRFECANVELAKQLQGKLSKEDFRISCY